MLPACDTLRTVLFADLLLMERVIAAPPSYSLMHLSSLVGFGVGGCLLAAAALMVPCARAHMWDAWHFKSLQDA